MASSGKITGSHLIAQALKLEGVHNVFTLAGDHILPVLDVMSDLNFRFIDTRHEQAAVHMADAWGRITRQPGVCMYTTPGFANAIPGLAHAMHSESPVISIAGSAEFSQLGKGAMQEIPQVEMAAPVTKASWMVQDARRIPEFIARAMRTAYSGRRGPVHLTIPMDIQEQEVDEEDIVVYNPREYRADEDVYANPELVRRAIGLLRQAQRPLVVASGPATHRGSGSYLEKFIETTRLPLMTEEHARGLVSDDHPYCYGFFDQGLNDAARLLREADVVVMLGRKQDYSIRYAQPPTIAAGASIIQIDPSAAEIGRNRGVAVGIVGDVASVVDQMTEEASKHTWTDLPWLGRLKEAQDAQAERVNSMAVEATPMHATYVHKTVGPMLSPDDILVFDGGDFCHWGRAYHPAKRDAGWLYIPSLGMLGSAIPTALAAKVAFPDSRVVCFNGDGSFGFNAMEIDTAVRHQIAVKMILGNDAAWGIDRQIQIGLYGRPVATDLLPQRYDLIAQGLGAHSEIVERPEDLVPAVQRAFDAPGPALVNVMVDRAISPRAQAAINRRRVG